MQCPRCQHENPAGQKFCGGCGTRLASVCLSCSASNPPGQKFCGECGTALGQADGPGKYGTPQSYTPRHLADKILSSKSALEGERKQVTVLFADLKGSMELLADRDPEEARKLLDPVLEHMMEAVHRYEGTVNQVMGDGIMALFGAPLAHEDHAVRACYAALRMQESVRRYGEGVRRSHGIEPQIRVGLNSGEVVVRSIGSDLHMDYTAVGQTTHLAARMEQLATPGAVRLTGHTLRLAEGFVEVKVLGPIPVKGLPEPIEVFELTGASPVRSRLQASAAHGLTKFVGRDAEMETLFTALEQAKAGKGQVVAVVGEPGVGKSRLVWEFTHSHRTAGCLVLEAPSVSYGKATTYLPVIDLLKRYAGIEPRDDARKIRERVTGKLFSLDRALEPCLAPLLWLLDVPVEDAAWERLDPPLRRQKLHEGLRRLLLRESREQPLVVVFEDLHWIDGETQMLLDGLVESLPKARLLLLVNYRPEYRHTWGSKTYYTQVRLDALPAASAAELLRALLGPDASGTSLVALLIARTEGNPFFLEETVQSLVETGMLTGERGAYRLLRATDALQIPATVQAILSARIDRLGPEAKRVLQTASVIGKDVPYPLLRAIADMDETALRAGLTRLQEAEFLYEVQLFPELEYTFKHALTHDVAYGSLLEAQRTALHLRVVAALTRLFASRLEEHVEQLALHASRGHAWDQAIAYGRQAGTKAISRCAYAEAVRFFEDALQAVPQLPDDARRSETAIDLRSELRSSLIVLGELEHCLALNDEEIHLAKALGDRRRTVRASLFRTNLLSMLGDPAGGLALGMEALRVAETIDDVAVQASSNFIVGQALQLLGDYPRAIGMLRKNLRLLPGDMIRERFSGNVSPTGLASQSWLAFCLAEQGDFDEAVALGECAMAAGESVSHAYAFGMAAWGRAYTALLRGEMSNAATICERLVSMCTEAEIINLVVPWSAGLGYARVLSGRVSEGLLALQHSRDHIAKNRYLEAQFLAWLAHGQGLAGQSSEALASARTALELSQRGQQRGQEAWALRIFGEIVMLATPNDVDVADEYLRQAAERATALAMRPLVAHCHAGLAKLSRRTGQRVETGMHWQTASAMYREMGMTYWLEKLERETGTAS